MQEIRNYQIEKGTRLAIVTKGGARIAGTAMGRYKEGRGADWSIRVKSASHGIVRIESEDIAELYAI